MLLELPDNLELDTLRCSLLALDPSFLRPIMSTRLRIGSCVSSPSILMHLQILGYMFIKQYQLTVYLHLKMGGCECIHVKYGTMFVPKTDVQSSLARM